MRWLPSCILAVAAALFLSGCSTARIAPAVYEEVRSDRYQWSLSMTANGRYSLLRVNPSMLSEVELQAGKTPLRISFELEKGAWAMKDEKIRLKNDSGSIRTFSVHQDWRGNYLVEDGKDFPVLRWSAKEPFIR